MANPRRVAKATLAFIVLLLGLAFAMQCDGFTMIASILVASIVAILLLRKTSKDEEYASRCVGDDIRNVKQPDLEKASHRGGTGGFLAINAVLGVLATPFAVLAKLLKMQK